MKIENKSFDYFKSCKRLGLENYQEILGYYKRRYSNDLPPFYHIMPEYNSVIKDNSFRYEIETVGDDKVFVAFKIIQIIKTKQIRVIGYPISLMGIKEHEDLVFSEYSKLPFVRIVLQEIMPAGFIELPTYDDYYMDLRKAEFSNKYKRDYGINKILKEDCYSVDMWGGRKLTINYEKLIKLKDNWIDGMQLNGSKVTTEFSKFFTNLILSDSKNIKKCVLWYNDTPLMMFIALCDDNIGAQALLQLVHIGRNEEIEGISKKVLHSMSEIQHWLLSEMYNNGILAYPKLYLAGSRPGEERLLKHKQGISDGVIRYAING